jgi:hypothetical protein
MEVKARDASLWAKIGAALIIVVGTVAIGIGWLKIAVLDVIWAALAIAGIFGTVDINLMLEKLGKKG